MSFKHTLIGVAVGAVLVGTAFQACAQVFFYPNNTGPHNLIIITAESKEEAGVYTGDAINVKVTSIPFSNLESCLEARCNIKRSAAAGDYFRTYYHDGVPGHTLVCQPVTVQKSEPRVRNGSGFPPACDPLP